MQALYTALNESWLGKDQSAIIASLDRRRDLKVPEADIREAILSIAVKLYDRALLETGSSYEAAKCTLQEVNRGLDNIALDIMQTRHERVEGRNLEAIPSVKQMKLEIGKYKRVTEERCSTPSAKWTVDKKAASVGASRLALSRSASSSIRLVGSDGSEIIKNNRVNLTAASTLLDQISKSVAENPDAEPFTGI